MRARAFYVFAVACALLALLQSATALYDAKGDVILVDSKNFKKEVLDTEQTVIVEFFAPWCGHCKQLAPTYAKVAEKLRGIVKVVAVDADADKSLGGQYGIRGFPTIKVFPGGGKKAKNSPVDYNGARSAKAIADFALTQMISYVKKVGSIESTSDFDVLVFSSKKETAPLLKALSVEFKDKLKIGEVQEKQKDICSEFGVTEFPTIVTLQPDGSRVKYDDAIKHKKLQRAFADLVAKKGGSSSTGSSDEDAESSGENAKETANVFSPPESVIQLTSQAQFEDECLSKKGVCVIAFVDTYEVDDAKKFQMVLEKVRKEKHSLKLFSFFWADGTQLTEEFTRDIQVPGGFPSAVIVFPAKNRIAPYVGAFTADAMGKYLEKILRGTLRTSPYEKLPVMLGAPVERSAEEPEEPSHDEL